MGTSSSKYELVTNDFELAIRSSKDLENVLDTQFGARGKGLHEKISSVERSLPQHLVRNMRYLATIRNKLVHEHGFNRIPQREQFIEKFDKSTLELEKVVEDRRQAKGSKAQRSRVQLALDERQAGSCCLICW